MPTGVGFGAEITNLGEGSAAGSTPHGGFDPTVVNTDITASRTAMLRDSTALVNNVIKQAPVFFAGNKDTTVSDFTSKIAAIAKARDAGTISATEAGARMRAAGVSAIAQSQGNPDIVKGIKDVWGAATQVAGADATQDLDNQRNHDKAVNQGLLELGINVPANPSRETQNNLNELYSQIKTAERENSKAADNLNYNIKKYNFDESKAASLRSQQATSAVNKLVKPSGDVFISTSNDIAKQIKDGSITLEQGRQQLQTLANNFRSTILPFQADAGPATNAVLSYIDKMEQDALTMIDPKTSAQDAKAINDRIISNNQRAALSDDGVAMVVATNQLFPNNPAVSYALLPATQRALKSVVDSAGLGDSSQPAAPVSGLNSAERKDYYEANKIAIRQAQDSIRAAQTSGGSPNTEQVDKLVNNTLASFSQIPPSARIDSYTDAVSFLASDEFKAWKSQGKLSQQALEGAQRAYDAVYLRRVQKPILNELDRPLTTENGPLSSGVIRGRPTPTLTMKDMFTVNYNNGVISFTPRSIPGTDNLQQSQVNVFMDQLNDTRVVLNQTIRAGANLKGESLDQYWEENKQFILPSFYSVKHPDLKIGDEVNGKVYIGGALNSRYSWKDKDVSD